MSELSQEFVVHQEFLRILQDGYHSASPAEIRGGDWLAWDYIRDWDGSCSVDSP
jgi:hypothetical protein